MKCLITGGAGFIGSHLAELLLDRGHAVMILDDLSTGKISNLIDAQPRITFYRGSVLNEELLSNLMMGQDQIYHLAAVVGVKEALSRPLETLEVNIQGTDNLLRLATPEQKILVVSSSEVYGYGAGSALKEQDSCILGSPLKSLRWGYGVSKLVDEFLALAYTRSYKKRITIVRPFNVVGPRQTGFYGMVLPNFIEQALEGKPITVFGTGEQTRCFAYVTEVVEIFYELLQWEETIGDVYNVAGREEIRIVNLARLVKAITKSNSEIVFVPYEEAYGTGFEDAMQRFADTRHLNEVLGHVPSIQIEDVIARTVEWMRGRLC